MSNLRFRYAWAVLFAISLVPIAISSSYIIFDHSFEPQANAAVTQISAISPSLGNFVSEMVRLIGLNWLTWGFLMATISVTAFRRGEMWAWSTLWIVPVYFIGDGAIDLLAGGAAWLGVIILAPIVVVTLLLSPQFDAILHGRKSVSNFVVQ